MIDPGKTVKTSNVAESPGMESGRRILSAILFGLAFGFLLQKGGVGKYHILIGQLLLQDFTVVKVMLTAIVVGMVGIFTLHRFAKVNLHLKPTRIGANIIGGLIFGAGFALIGYCPGTVAAALGQGSYDGLFAMTGLILGSYLFAEFSKPLKSSVEKWGEKGKLMLPEALRIPREVFIPVFTCLLFGVLVALGRFTVR
jgi:uncharacterized membrane protein YedE/YeeE